MATHRGKDDSSYLLFSATKYEKLTNISLKLWIASSRYIIAAKEKLTMAFP